MLVGPLRLTEGRGECQTKHSEKKNIVLRFSLRVVISPYNKT